MPKVSSFGSIPRAFSEQQLRKAQAGGEACHMHCCPLLSPCCKLDSWQALPAVRNSSPLQGTTGLHSHKLQSAEVCCKHVECLSLSCL